MVVKTHYRSAGTTAAALLSVMLCWPASAWAICSNVPTDFVPTPPGQLLDRYPNGGGAMVSEIRNLAATTANGVSAIEALVKDANPSQKRAIGAGLGQAAAVCSRPDPATARGIQEAIVALDSPDVSVAYQAATGDRETGSTGSGGSGASGGGLGGGGTIGESSTFNGTNGYYAPSTMVTPNLITPFNLFGSSVSLLETSSSTGGSSSGVSPATSVSPSK